MHTEESLMALVNEAINSAEAAERDRYSPRGSPSFRYSNARAREDEAALRLAIREVLSDNDQIKHGKWYMLVKDICEEWNERCEGDCDSFGHSDNCAAVNIAVAKRRLRERAERAEAECERLRKLLLRSKRGHYYCEDSWYSCPKEPESGCADESQGTECNCGADKWNAEVDAALQEKKP